MMSSVQIKRVIIEMKRKRALQRASAFFIYFFLIFNKEKRGDGKMRKR